MRIKNKKYLLLFGIILVFVSLFFIGLFNFILERTKSLPDVRHGATFSNQYARSLGLDPRQIFISAMDDLGVRKFRIPAYWEEIEAVRGTYNFNDLDWMLEEANKRNARVILAIGYKLPRWPECHAPEWARVLPPEERTRPVLQLVRALVERYRDSSAIWAWQVENEPFFEYFGECPKLNPEFLAEEVELVKSLDDRPVIITESGELSFWSRADRYANILGISMYRISWNKYLGYIYYPLSPGFYRWRARAVKNLFSRVIVTELQAEPWVPDGILNASLDEQFKSMNPNRLRDNINFVRRADFDEVYLWGIEWWYWLKEKQGDSSMLDVGREIFRMN